MEREETEITQMCKYAYVNLRVGSSFFKQPSIERVGIPRWFSGKESTCQWRSPRRCGFNPWVGKMPWRRAWQPTPVFLTGESPWTEEPDKLQFMESQTDTTERLSTYYFKRTNCVSLKHITYLPYKCLFQ